MLGNKNLTFQHNEIILLLLLLDIVGLCINGVIDNVCFDV